MIANSLNDLADGEIVRLSYRFSDYIMWCGSNYLRFPAGTLVRVTGKRPDNVIGCSSVRVTIEDGQSNLHR